MEFWFDINVSEQAEDWPEALGPLVAAERLLGRCNKHAEELRQILDGLSYELDGTDDLLRRAFRECWRALFDVVREQGQGGQNDRA
jgi:hypothetical protein